MLLLFVLCEIKSSQYLLSLYYIGPNMYVFMFLGSLDPNDPVSQIGPCNWESWQIDWTMLI